MILNAVLVKKNMPLSGFGGSTIGNLYEVSLDIGGILYPSMHIIANNEINATFNLILSATMFEGFIYQIDTVNHMLNIEIPDRESNVRNFRIMNKEGKVFVLRIRSGVEAGEDEGELRIFYEKSKNNGTEKRVL